MRTAAQAVSVALSYASHGTAISPGMCDHYAAAFYGLSHSGFSTAKSHYLSTPTGYRHGTSTAPLGALCFWGGGSSGAGHVAISIGGGRIVSTDMPRSGRCGVVSLGTIGSLWGLPYYGWTDAWYGSQGVVRVAGAPTPPPRPVPVPHGALHLHLLKPGLKNSDVVAYQRAIRTRNALGRFNPSGATGYYGTETEAMTHHAYTDVLHLLGGDLNTPGPTLLRWLGFTPVA